MISLVLHQRAGGERRAEQGRLLCDRVLRGRSAFAAVPAFAILGVHLAAVAGFAPAPASCGARPRLACGQRAPGSAGRELPPPSVWLGGRAERRACPGAYRAEPAGEVGSGGKEDARERAVGDAARRPRKREVLAQILHSLVVGRPGGVRTQMRRGGSKTAPPHPADAKETQVGAKKSQVGAKETQVGAKDTQRDKAAGEEASLDASLPWLSPEEDVGSESDASERDTAPCKELSRAVTRSLVVDAPVEACFAVVADLDKYVEWCHQGLQGLQVLERDDSSSLPTRIKLAVSKFGIRAVNSLRVSYPQTLETRCSERVVEFRSESGHAIKDVAARYVLTPLLDSPGRTLVSFELTITFAFALPDVIRDKFVNTIVNTALEMLSARIISQPPHDEDAFRRRLLETARAAEDGGGGRAVIEDVGGQVIRKSVVVESGIRECYAVAANLEGYTDWCAKSGLETIRVLSRDHFGRARRVIMLAAKFGLRTANVLEYQYSHLLGEEGREGGGEGEREGDIPMKEMQVAFKCIRGDVMPKLDGRYSFRELSQDSPVLRTEITYELEIEFAMGVLSLARARPCARALHASVYPHFVVTARIPML